LETLFEIPQRSRIVAWREGLGLIGVLVASVAPVVLGLPATAALFSVALALGWFAWTRAVRPVAHAARQAMAPAKRAFSSAGSLWRPLGNPDFRRLLTVFMLSGIASAIPATLVLFFVQDLLQAGPAMEPLFLGGYFLSAALSIPVWLALVKRIGLARAWLGGMALSVMVFVWATQLGTGQTTAFTLICLLSGLALGADLALPGALLAGVIQRSGESGQSEGAYFGCWNFATKLNLALAAGLALPVLGLFGYAPGVRDPQALSALLVAYCVLPCLLKLAAAFSLYLLIISPTESAKA